MELPDIWADLVSCLKIDIYDGGILLHGEDRSRGHYRQFSESLLHHVGKVFHLKDSIVSHSLKQAVIPSFFTVRG